MKPEFQKILRCTECNRGKVNLSEHEQRAECEVCGAMFPFSEGALNMLRAPRAELLRELRGEEIEKQERPHYKPGECIATPDIFWEDFQAIRGHVRLAEDALILDLGTGKGDFISQLADEGRSCVGVDLKVHNPELVKKMDIILADMNNLPFFDEGFNLVVAASAVHHSYDLEKTFREAARVLKPGGQFMLLNEPLKGLLKNNRRFRHYRNPFIHERAYWLTTYILYAYSAGLRPRLFFPKFIDNRLRDGDFRYDRFKRLARIAAGLWKWKWLRSAAIRIGFYPTLFLLGIPLVMICDKK
jgi:SAM-dependent methyltransferase